MLSEQEITSRHMQSLKEARDCCDWLGKQLDPALAAPRGRRYAQLRKALTELEGSARQMAHWRQDARWLKLGIHYAKVMRVAQAKYVGQRWGAFKAMVQIFDAGLRSLDDLQTRKTGTLGAILPARPSDWLVLPNHRVPRPSDFQTRH
jgi:hypothetical protein